jgi:HAD superfamily hydrolase (TIGR01549 family)
VKNVQGKIVFDLDETLIASHDAIMHNLPKVVKQIIGVMLQDNESNSRASFKRKMVKVLGPIFTGSSFNYRIYPDVLNMLKMLQADGHTLYLWTLRDRKSAKAILLKLGIYSYFTDCMYGDDIEMKPNPQILTVRFGDQDPDSTIMVGNSLSDIMAAKNYGCKSIAVGWGKFLFFQGFWKHQADFFANNPNDCYSIIKNYFLNFKQHKAA